MVLRDVAVFHGGKCNLLSVVSFASRKLLKALGKEKLAKVLTFKTVVVCWGWNTEPAQI